MAAQANLAQRLLLPGAEASLAEEGLTVRVEIDGVDEEARVLAALARIAERSERCRSMATLAQVSAGVTHEVRNVMTGILGFTQLAMKRVASRPETAQELLQVIERESQRCLEMLTHYLTFTRPRRDVDQDVDLAELVATVARLVFPQLQLQNIKLDVNVVGQLPRLRGDPAGLTQVLINLLLNAMYASASGGSVHLSVVAGDDGGASIQVSDEGPGVPPELAARIFEPFFTTKPEGQGSGIGLSLSREIVEAQGGTLTLDSVGAGAVFTIRLPAPR